MNYIAEIAAAIQASHGCKATHQSTVAVREMFRGKVAWEGEVEVFTVTGHAKAKRCYAWGYPNEKRGGKYDFVTVLEIPPVTSPETAVKAAIHSEAKSKR